MFVYFAIYVILWQTYDLVTCKPTDDSVTDATVTILPLVPTSNVNDTKIQGFHISGDNHFHAEHQTFYLNGRSACKSSTDSGNTEIACVCGETRGIRARVTSLRLHLQPVTWDQARKICVDEGGHLAVLRMDEEEKIVLQMMTEKSVEIAWLGLHNRFDNDVWISVFDEPLEQTGWYRWSTKFSPNPATAHCVTLVKNGGGMTDNECELKIPFVCRVAIS